MRATVFRAEKQTDPDKMPGQIINRPEQTLGGYIARVQAREQELYNGCCQTVIERCEGCPYATINS